MALRPGRILIPLALLLAGCASTTSSIPSAWMSVPEAPRIRAIPVAVLPPRPASAGPFRIEGGRLFNAEKPVTDAFAAIESFDYSASRDEVVFSAKREAGFDIGLAAADGSVVNWIPNDPADEVMVEWAPRGNKISYVVRAPLGDVVRTFHVPSSFHFVADFGAATIHALGWDEPAERFAVAYNTIEASDRVEVMRYEAKERRMAVPPAEAIAADVLPFVESALVLRPLDLRYREQVPVVIWLADRFEWNDARAALMKNARVACIVTRGAADEALMKRVRETAWLDSTRVYIVGGRASRPPASGILPDATPPGETPGGSGRDARPPWRGIFRDLPREHGFEPLRVEGRIPEELRGVLYRCGPARFSSPGGEPYLHWFDADGAVAAVRFDSGRCQAAVRVVDTRWLRKERDANGQLYRSYAQLGRGWRRWLTLPKNPANISVMPWDGEVLALWEAGLPIALDPNTLATRGETNLGGRIGPTLSAHPHRVGGTIFNFGIRYGTRFALHLYAFTSEITRITTVPLARPTLVHDFIATQRHLIFLCAPVRLRLARLLAGIGSFDENLVWEPQHGTEVIVIPLATPDRPTRFTVPPFFQWHFVNAWEDGRNLVVDHIPYDDFETNDWFGRAPYDPARTPPPSRYARARLDLDAKRMMVEVLSDRSCEFPAIHFDDAGRPHETAWMLAFDLPPTLCRFETKTRTWRPVPLGPDTVPGEPSIVPRAGHKDGWVLSLVYDGTRDASYIAVIDGARPEDGPVARVWFDHQIPFLFHGTWEGSR